MLARPAGAWRPRPLLLAGFSSTPDMQQRPRHAAARSAHEKPAAAGGVHVGITGPHGPHQHACAPSPVPTRTPHTCTPPCPYLEPHEDEHPVPRVCIVHGPQPHEARSRQVVKHAVLCYCVVVQPMGQGLEAQPGQQPAQGVAGDLRGRGRGQGQGGGAAARVV